MNPPVSISVVVPLYNEERNIRPLVEGLNTVLQGTGELFEIILVNDGSQDGTRAVIEELRGKFPWIRPVHLAGNFGQSSGLDAGFKAATGEKIITLDGDLQYDPGDIPGMLARLGEFDAVCGYRESRADSGWKRFQSRVANAIRNELSGDSVRDTGCALRVIRKEAVSRLTTFNGMHRFIPTLLRIEGFKVLEVPVRHYPRRYGESKYGAANRMFEAFHDLLGVRWLKKRHLAYKVEER